jgi:soluble lytic murein transglycosylase-like protein
MKTPTHGLRGIALALLLATMAMCTSADAETSALGTGAMIQPLAEQIVLDNSNDLELVISNTDGEDADSAPAAPSNRANPSRWKNGTVPYQAEVQAAAEATSLDPALIHAVIATESGYNPRALSRKGAYGLMQVLPATAQTMTVIPVRQWSVPQQILWGSHYLKKMLDMFEGNVTLALAAYNAGPQAVKAHQHAVPPFAETRQYVPKVLGYYQVFKTRLTAASYAGQRGN